MKNKFLKITCCALAFSQFDALGTDIPANTASASKELIVKNYEIKDGNYMFLGNLDENGKYKFLWDPLVNCIEECSPFLDENDLKKFPSVFFDYLSNPGVDVREKNYPAEFHGLCKLKLTDKYFGVFFLKSIAVSPWVSDFALQDSLSNEELYPVKPINSFLHYLIKNHTDISVSKGNERLILFSIILKIKEKNSHCLLTLYFISEDYIDYIAQIHQKEMDKIKRLLQ